MLGSLDLVLGFVGILVLGFGAGIWSWNLLLGWRWDLGNHREELEERRGWHAVSVELAS